MEIILKIKETLSTLWDNSATQVDGAAAKVKKSKKTIQSGLTALIIKNILISHFSEFYYNVCGCQSGIDSWKDAVDTW